MIEQARSMNITSDMAYGAALGSIILSILIWSMRRGQDTANAERFGIFVGLWAPTFAIFGSILEQHERRLFS